MKIEARRRAMGRLLPRVAICVAGLVVISATTLLAIIASTNGYFSAVYLLPVLGLLIVGGRLIFMGVKGGRDNQWRI